MTSSRESPSGDGLNALFRDLGFENPAAASQANSAPTTPPAAPVIEAPTQSHQYLSRRELRASQQASPAPQPNPSPANPSLASAPPPAFQQPVQQPVVQQPLRAPQPPIAAQPFFQAEAPPVTQAREQPTRTRRSQSAAPSKPAPRSKRTPKGQYRPPQPFVRPVDSAYPADRLLVVVRQPKKTVRSRGKSFLTVLAVVGLFGSVALPAYALAPKEELAPVSQKVASASLAVPDTATIDAVSRGEFSATNAVDLRKQRATARMNANYEAYVHSGALELGDDYPYFSQLSTNQGGGLSPFNYFYRECVDFVAWRLNRDAGYLSAPYLYDWSYLTPTGGNAYQWRYAWRNHGWATSTTPSAGWVAWFSSNHVAYVKRVNGDGTVLLEEYNWQNDHTYSQRTIQPSEAQLYLSPPPR